MVENLVDGSVLEGGGQILRTAFALSAILHLPLKITRIRAGRPKPGLAAQHLEGVRLVSKISCGTIHGDEIGSTELKYTGGPHNLEPLYVADCGTAGAISLLIQISLPCLLCHTMDLITIFPSSRVTAIKFFGGTNVNFSPPIDHVIHVFLPLLSLMSSRVAPSMIRVLKRGFYPRGGGAVELNFDHQLSKLNERGSDGDGRETNSVCGGMPLEVLRPINLTERGSVTSFHAVVFGNCSIEEKMTMRNMLLRRVEDTLIPLAKEETIRMLNLLNIRGIQNRSVTAADDVNEMMKGESEIEANQDNSNVTTPTVTMDISEDEDDEIPGGKLNPRKRGGNSDNNSNPNDVRKGASKFKYEVKTIGALIWYKTDTGCILSSNGMLQYKEYVQKNSSSMNPGSVSIRDAKITSSSTRPQTPADTSTDSEFLPKLTECVSTIVDDVIFLFNSGACVDEHTADQLLIYMSLAQGESRILCAPIGEESSLHIETVIKVASELGGSRFRTEDILGVSGSACRLITCSGKPDEADQNS